jgi:hypothetical protein
MNLRHLFCVGTVAALLGAAAQFADARVNVDLTVGIPPPPVVVEPLPPPMPHYVWVPGYWGWDGHGYVWVPGYWIPERPGWRYVPPHWQAAHGRWHLRPGHWVH